MPTPWEVTFEGALAKARSENRLLMAWFHSPY